MALPSAFTLTNPQDGNLAIKIFSFRDNSPFDHLQRLNYYSVILLTHGQGRLSADFAQYDFRGPTLFFFAPYQPFMFSPAEDVRGVTLNFHPDFFCIHHHQKEIACNGVLFNNIYQSPALTLSGDEVDEFLALIEQMKPAVINAGLGQQELLVSWLKIFLIRASRLKVEQTPIPSPEVADNRKTELVQNLRDAIENHYRTKHSAGDYAAMLHISPKVLGRITKAHFNKTITNLVSERIIIEAKRELYLTSRTVKEIAYALGFEDEYYFSRFFKINADVSPQTFRETVGFARGEDSSEAILKGMAEPGIN